MQTCLDFRLIISELPPRFAQCQETAGMTALARRKSRSEFWHGSRRLTLVMGTLANQVIHAMRTARAMAEDFLGMRLGGRCRVERMMLLLHYTIAVRWRTLRIHDPLRLRQQ